MEPFGPRGVGHPLLRVVIYLPVLLVVVAVLGVLASPILAAFDLIDPDGAGGVDEIDTHVLLGATVVASLVILLITHLFLRLWDRCSWGEVFARWPRGAPNGAAEGLRAPLGEALGGYALSAALLLILLGGLRSGGWLTIDGWGDIASRGLGGGVMIVAAYAAAFLVQGGTEEVIFRGYVLRNLALWRGVPLALVGNTLPFALAHGFNPGTGPLSLINTLLIGILLGMLRIRFSLWIAVGFHASWNLLLTLVAVPVSGLSPEGLLASRVTGPALWTGGAYGLEASLLTTILMVVGCLALLLDRRLREALRWRSA
jgi:membrane protease YdiL (CAAX protease family)